MTPTPQSLDTVTLEAAAKIADEYEARAMSSDELTVASNIAAAIRARATRPAAGEGEDWMKEAAAEILENFDYFGPDKEDAPRLALIIAKHAPAASPVQGVEVETLREALRNVKAFVVGEKHPNWTNDNTTYFTRGKIADICDLALDPSLTATPQAPSTVDERVTYEMLAAAMHVYETTEGLPFPGLVRKMIRAALDASREK